MNMIRLIHSRVTFERHDLDTESKHFNRQRLVGLG